MDVDAFTAFYAQTARPLWLYLFRVTRNAADTDDILQEAFCRLLGAERELTTEEQFRKYVFRIASNLLVDRWRLQQREMISELDEARITTAPQALNEGDNAMRMLARVPPRERALLWLAHVEGYSHDEIAQALGLARGSVRVLLFRARKRLRDVLNG
jgi:RNA polymerase sigma-70 factor, ECF subfamily